jgi:hypothetical protein
LKTEYGPEVLTHKRGDTYGPVSVSTWSKASILRDGDEILTAEQNCTLSVGEQKIWSDV